MEYVPWCIFGHGHSPNYQGTTAFNKSIKANWVVMPRLRESGPFQGAYGQPWEANQNLLGPIWAIFRPTKFLFFIFWPTGQIAPNFLHWNAHIFHFGLILRDIPNSITPQTTIHLLPILVGLLVLSYTRQCRRSPLTPSPPYSLPPFFFLSRTE